VLCTHGLFTVHRLQRVEDVRLANECFGFLGLLHRRTSRLRLHIPHLLDILQLPSGMA
jgi:hypothetical protein